MEATTTLHTVLSPARPAEAPTPARRRGAWPEVLPAIVFGGLLLLFFSMLRGVLFVAHRGLAVDVDGSGIARAFGIGMRFDAAVSAYATLFWMPAAALASRCWGHGAARWLWSLATTMTIGSLSLLGLAEVEFYGEFFTRYNSLAWQYWRQPTTVASMLWHGYPVVRYTLLALLWTGVWSWAARRLFLRRDNPATATAGARAAGMRGALLVGVLVVLARGGVRGTPLTWGDAVHSASPFANHLAQNGVWSLAKAFATRSTSDRLADMWDHSPSADEAALLARELVVAPGEAPSHDPDRPLARAGGDVMRSVPWNSETSAPPNVVVIVMESFTARYCGACGADATDDDHTPEFNRLAREGVLFRRAFSVGTHTHQALYGVGASFPNLPGHEALMEDATHGAQPFDALPLAFQRRGYETLFLYNGDFAWENIGGFYRLQGVDRFVGRGDFDSASYLDPTWGVTDDTLFERANQEFAKAKGPFCAMLLTLSNHAPFKMPRPLPFPETTDKGPMNDRINGIRYADWALGRFFERARQEAYFQNTLFVLVGDHGFSVAPVLTELRLLRFHVPLLFYAPGLLGREPRAIDRVASQLDIAPTVLRLVGDRESHQHWGRDLFALDEGDPGWACFKPSENSSESGFAIGDRLLVKTNSGETKLYRYDLGFPPRVEPEDDPELLEEMDRHLAGLYYSAREALVSHHVGPAEMEQLAAEPKRDEPRHAVAER